MPRWSVMAVSALCVMDRWTFGRLRPRARLGAALPLEGGGYGAASQNHVALVDNDGLARGDGALGRIEDDLHAAVGLARKQRRLVRLAIAVLGAHADAAGVQCGIHPLRGSAPNPVVRLEGTDRQVLELSKVDGVAGCVDAGHINGASHGDAKALALADGVAKSAIVASNYGAVAPDDIAGLGSASAAVLDKARIVTVRNKADVLAFGLFCVGKTLLGGDAAHVALFIEARERKDRTCQGSSPR